MIYRKRVMSTIPDNNLIICLQKYTVAIDQQKEKHIRFSNTCLVPSFQEEKRTWQFILSADVKDLTTDTEYVRIMYDFSNVDSKIRVSFSFPMEGTISWNNKLYSTGNCDTYSWNYDTRTVELFLKVRNFKHQKQYQKLFFNIYIKDPTQCGCGGSEQDQGITNCSPSDGCQCGSYACSGNHQCVTCGTDPSLGCCCGTNLC